MRGSILLVEDEAELCTTLGVRLKGEGYEVDVASDGAEGFEKATTLTFDLIILDAMLPYRSGFDVCRDIRQAGLATPIMLLTVRNSTIDKVLGLKLGADDYVTKPFAAVELIARIEVLLRRVPVRVGPGVHRFGSLCIDTRRAEVTRDGNPVPLTLREFQLLCYMVERAGTTIPRAELLRSVWGYDASTLTRTVDFHVAKLRQKLEANSKDPSLIATVTGVGYKFVGSGNKESPAH
jgi:two-component system alkaline phosphatase synthesis response regulator PhoP